MPSRRAVVTLPMVMKLARSAARLCLFSEMRASSCCTATDPRSRTTRRSGSASRKRVGDVREAGHARADVVAALDLGVEDDPAVVDEARRLGKRLGGGGGQGVARVDEPLQVGAAALERLGQLVDRGDEGVARHRRDRVVDVLEQLVDADREGRAVARDDVTGGEVGRPGGARLQVEVLLPHRRAVLDDGLGVLRASRCRGRAARRRATPSPDRRSASTLPDRDAAVGDLGADEDAAGLGEVGGDDVAAAGDLVGQPDVVGREDGDEGDGQQGEGGELEPHGRA